MDIGAQKKTAPLTSTNLVDYHLKISFDMRLPFSSKKTAALSKNCTQ
jgi:hypothetical protein